jgi:hypothetical protein
MEPLGKTEREARFLQREEVNTCSVLHSFTVAAQLNPVF